MSCCFLAPHQNAKLAQEQLKEHNQEPKFLFFSLCKSRDRFNQLRPHPATHISKMIRIQRPSGRHQNTPKEVLRPRPDGPQLFWWPTQNLTGGFNVVADQRLAGLFLCDRAVLDKFVVIFLTMSSEWKKSKNKACAS